MRQKLPILLAIILLILHLPVIFSPVNYLLTWFNTDDAFYYFVPARNVAAGQGFTFDGIARTNGFHPLWMLILVPIFSLSDQILPLRILAGLLLCLNIGTAWLLFRLASRYFSPGVAFLTALAFSLLPIIHNETTKGGVEAGLNVFFIVLFLNRLSETDPRNRRSVWITSSIACLTFLARLDNIFFTGLSGIWLLYVNWNRSVTRPWQERLRLATTYFLPLGLIVLAYMTWNQIGFGTPTPVSGQVKRWWGTLPNTVYGFPPKRLSNYIGQFVTDDQSIGPWAIITGPFYRTAEGAITLLGQEPTVEARRLTLALLGVTGLGGLGWLGWRNRAWVWEGIQGLSLIPLLAGCLMQIAYYKVGGSVAQRTWYWVAEMLWVVLAGGLLAEMGWKTFQAVLGMKRYVTGSAYVIVSLLGLWFIWPHILRIPRIFSVDTLNGEAFYLRRANWLEANTEPGALIGMTGSGSSGYFTEGRTIVNLDGLIGSVEYFKAMQEGTADRYLEGIGLDYVFGNMYILQESDPYAEIFEGHLELNTTYEDGERVLALWRYVIP
jgi:hypothetical protein